MKRVPALLIVVALLATPVISVAQDGRAIQASRVVQLALILMAANHPGHVNVNRDSAREISTKLPEISPDVAENIVAHRSTKGRFGSLLDLLKVPGVSRDVVTRNRHRIVL